MVTGRTPAAGFSYVMLLFAVAIASISLAGTGVLWQLESKREKEKELLFIGEQYRKAIDSYYTKSPGGDRQYPEKLEDLLQDKRFPKPVSHLRRRYREPMMEDGEWTLIREDGRIVGVASRSTDMPIKISGFPPVQEGFASAEQYSGWRFLSSGAGSAALPSVSPVAQAPAPAAAQAPARSR